MRFDMIEHVLEVIDIPRIREPQQFIASMKIHSVCGVTKGMFCPVRSIENAKTSALLSSRNK